MLLHPLLPYPPLHLASADKALGEGLSLILYPSNVGDGPDLKNVMEYAGFQGSFQDE